MNTFKTSRSNGKMSNEKLRAAVKLAAINKPYLQKGSIGEAWRTLAQEINSQYPDELPLSDRIFHQKIIQTARDVVRQQRVDNTTGSNQTSGDFEEACLIIVAYLVG